MSRLIIPRGPVPKQKSTKGGRETARTRKDRTEWARGFILCGMCECSRAQHTHHMRYGCQRYDQPWNWLPICAECHDLIHEPSKRRWLIFLAKRKEKCDPLNSNKNVLLGG